MSSFDTEYAYYAYYVDDVTLLISHRFGLFFIWLLIDTFFSTLRLHYLWMKCRPTILLATALDLYCFLGTVVTSREE